MYLLHITVFWICVAIGIIVFGTLIYSHQSHKRTPFELLWVIIPFIILIIIAIPATKILMSQMT